MKGFIDPFLHLNVNQVIITVKKQFEAKGGERNEEKQRNEGAKKRGSESVEATESPSVMCNPRRTLTMMVIKKCPHHIR